MRHWLAAVVAAGLLTPGLVSAQAFGPAHHTFAIVGNASVTVRPAFNRRLLGLINNSANVIYCTVDGETAAVNEGIRLEGAGTAGGIILFDRQVPQGPVRCMSATEGSRVLIIEGR